MNGLRFTLLGLAVSAVLALAACGGGKPEDATESPNTVVERFTVTETESMPADDPHDRDITYSVRAFHEVRSIQLEPYSHPSVLRPGASARLIVARMIVTNKGDVDVEPFCGDSGALLVDKNNRNFEPLDRSDIPGGACGHSLAPGQQDTYTLAFQVPKATHVSGLYVWDSDSLGNPVGTSVLFRV